MIPGILFASKVKLYLYNKSMDETVERSIMYCILINLNVFRIFIVVMYIPVIFGEQAKKLSRSFSLRE